MQHTTGVAVVATHLAITDRRALSEAWYGALRLAHEAAPAPGGSPRRAPSAGSGTPRTLAARASDAPPSASTHREGRSAAESRASRQRYEGLAERRLPATELARRLECALTRRVRRVPTTSFALRAAGGRVHVLVRSDGARTRILALCAPPLRERVERAMAHARFALAASGVRTEVA